LSFTLWVLITNVIDRIRYFISQADLFLLIKIELDLYYALKLAKQKKALIDINSVNLSAIPFAGSLSAKFTKHL
jgi:hypothetical protein